jgi:hypothetical protein
MTSQTAIPSFVRRSRVMFACVALISTLVAVVQVPHGAMTAPARASMIVA